MMRIYKMYKHDVATFTDEIANICAMCTRATFPKHKVPTINILPFEPTLKTPSIIHSEAPGEYWTMDINTFNIVGHGLENSSNVRILLSRSSRTAKLIKESNCTKDWQAIRENTCSARGMKVKMVKNK